MNKWIGIGNLTQDPAPGQTPQGIPYTRFSIAVNRQYKDANGNPAADFLSCIAWRGIGETIAKYTHRGDKVLVVGAIETRSYAGKDGVKKTSFEINVSEIEFLNQSKGSRHEPNGDGVKPRQQSMCPDKQSLKKLSSDEYDDIPF